MRRLSLENRHRLIGTATAQQQPIPFADARVIVEVNDTDGDAGLQMFIPERSPGCHFGVTPCG
jgi:hypothetical protein